MINKSLYNKQQRVELNGQSSKRQSIRASVLQRNLSRILFFLIYINDLLQRVYSEVEHFVNDTSLFCIANYVKTSIVTY